ncbi:ImmA/IrrE family metallo-endopeptidase [Parabacteroides leei]|uniref:ImmA/IrrE family metallo-endopeptidase n=3 Tax=Bacteroidales TaxID=171549 RepID=UPI0018983F0A|nr:ImmA/IrrE family metallo-endopeptidase [Parabacteroides goldsteinii]
MINRGALKAISLLDEIGLDEITDIPMDIFVPALGATLIKEPLGKCDGKIIRGTKKTLIKVNANIPYEERMRFAIAHEVGHFLLHEKLEVHNENHNTLNWFKETEKQAKMGVQEFEANEFASELLMPRKLCFEECHSVAFSPQLIERLSKRFKTSITSTVFKYCKLNIHPILIISIRNGKIEYFCKSEDFRYRIKDLIKLSPPENSVANEYIEANYDFIYRGIEKQQEIVKSTWLNLGNYEKDSTFFEYCIPTKQYNTIISIIWEK